MCRCAEQPTPMSLISRQKGHIICSLNTILFYDVLNYLIFNNKFMNKKKPKLFIKIFYASLTRSFGHLLSQKKMRLCHTASLSMRNRFSSRAHSKNVNHIQNDS